MRFPLSIFEIDMHIMNGSFSNHKFIVNLLIFILLFLLSGPSLANSCDPSELLPEMERMFENDFGLKFDEINDKIYGPLSIAEVEKESTVKIEIEGKMRAIPFGYINDKWEEFKALYSSGDCIYHFKTGPKSWAALYGREGYILVREGKIIHYILSALS